MSDKKIALLNKEQADLDRAQVEFNLKSIVIKSIPDEISMPTRVYVGAYCADVSLYFETKDLATLLRAFPAMPCTFIDGDTVSVKPTALLRNSDHGKRRFIFPVIRKISKGEKNDTIFWWSTVGDDIKVDICVNVVGAPFDPRVIIGEEANRYEPGGYSYSTGSTSFFKLHKKSIADFNLKSPMTSWTDAWDEFAKQKGWNEAQMQFVRTYQMLTANGHDTNYPLRENNQNPFFDTFWKRFSESDVADLTTLIHERKAALPAVQEEIAQSLIRAETWLRTFFATKGSPVPLRNRLVFGVNGNLDLDDLDVLRYLFKKETGLAGSLNWATDYEGEVEVGYTLDKAHIRPRCVYLKDAPRINWDELAECC